MSPMLREDLERLEAHYREDAPLDVDALVAGASAAGARAVRRRRAAQITGGLALTGVLGIGLYAALPTSEPTAPTPAGGSSRPASAAPAPTSIAPTPLGTVAPLPNSPNTPPPTAIPLPNASPSTALVTPDPPVPTADALVAELAQLERDLDTAVRAHLPAGTTILRWGGNSEPGAGPSLTGLVETSRGRGTLQVNLFDERLSSAYTCDVGSAGRGSCSQTAVPAGRLLVRDAPETGNDPADSPRRIRWVTLVRPAHGVVEISTTNRHDGEKSGAATTMPFTDAELTAIATSPDLVDVVDRYLPLTSSRP